MYQLTRRLLHPMTAASKPVAQKTVRLRRLVATSTFALLSFATYQSSPAQAQALNVGQACYAVADNDTSTGINGQDTLVQVEDFGSQSATGIANITRPDGTPIDNIEALTSRSLFGELIAANGNEIGRLDPLTGVFTSLGVLTPYADFDAIAIDRASPGQTRFIGVSKRSGADAENAVVEATIQLDANNQAVSISAPTELSRIAPDQFPLDTRSIDGIALGPNSRILYGVANDGPNSAQRFVIIDPINGTIEDRGPFLSPNGTIIPDVEDLAFDLVSNQMFVTSGNSTSSPLAENAFLYAEPNGVNLAPAISNFNLQAATTGDVLIDGTVLTNGAVDFEASACLRPADIEPETGDLLLIKRITAITPLGQPETRFTDLEDQPGQVDDQLRTATSDAFPQGELAAPNPLNSGDLVEYTVYIYNPTQVTFTNIELCDPLQRPSVLQPDTIQFAPPDGTPALNFADINGANRSPQAPADASCAAALGDSDQFIAGPPGPIGPQGTGGGVETEPFDLAPGEIAAVRFVVEVGTLQDGDLLEDL